MPEKLRRVHIIGGPGSGKTTLARALARRLGAPAFDLDVVAYERGAGPKRSDFRRVSDIRGITALPCWVTEGVYLGWTRELFERAEAIIWLDVPWRVAAWRIVIRHVQASLRGRNQHPGLGRFVRFVWSARAYYLDAGPPPTPGDDIAISRSQTKAFLKSYRGRVVRLRSGDFRSELKQAWT